jgi:ribosome-associated translation inhibitor RaiA
MIIEQLSEEELQRLRLVLNELRQRADLAASMLQGQLETVEKQREKLDEYADKLERQLTKTSRSRKSEKQAERQVTQ